VFALHFPKQAGSSRASAGNSISSDAATPGSSRVRRRRETPSIRDRRGPCKAASEHGALYPEAAFAVASRALRSCRHLLAGRRRKGENSGVFSPTANQIAFYFRAPHFGLDVPARFNVAG
jgi:hypothetical protein